MVIIAFCLGFFVGLPSGIFAAVRWAQGVVGTSEEHKFIKSVENLRKKRNL